MSGFNTTIQTGFARSRSEALFPRLFPDAGWWCPSLQSPGSTRLHDLRGGNWGTLTSMDPATDWVVNGGKGALDFDGSNDYVASIGSLASFSFVQNTMRFGFSFWMKLAATGTRYTIAGSTNVSTERGFFLIFENGAGVGTRAIRLAVFRGVSGSVVSDFRSADNAINDTDWHHVAITAAGNGNSGRVFVDGRQLSTTVPTNLNSLATGNSTRTLTIGSQTNGFTLPFGGQLDDFRLFRSPLSGGDARQLWQLGRGNMPIARRRRYTEQEAAAGFKAYWARRQSQLIGGGL
jgi:hypothetical protein